MIRRAVESAKGKGAGAKRAPEHSLDKAPADDMICAIMQVSRIRSLRRRIQRLRDSRANVRFRQLKSLAEAIGRRSAKRGKHPTFEKEGRPPLPIPNHPRAMSPITVDGILDLLEEDLDYEEGIGDAEE